MKKSQLILWPLLLLWSHWIMANDVTITLDVDSAQITPEESFTAIVTIKGNASGLGAMQLQGLDQFQSDGGQQTSMRTQIINGVVSMERSYEYALAPLKTGQFTLGPASVVVDGKSYSSNTVKIVVSNNPGQNPGQAAANGATGPTPSPNANTPFLFEAEVDDTTPYVGQQIIYRVTFYNRAAITQGSYSVPEFQDFIKEQLGEVRRYQKIINGVPWEANEFKIALYPQRSGELTIPATTVNLAVAVEDPRARARSLFGGMMDPEELFGMGLGGIGRRVKNISLKTKTIHLKVADLPPRPAHLPASLPVAVGTFTLEDQLSKTTLKAGESTTLTLKIKGDGNIRDVQLNFPSSPQYKIYEDKPQVATTQADRIYGSKIFKLAIVPESAGTIPLPPIPLTFFNPRTQSYQTVQTQAYTLNVSPGDEKSNYQSFQNTQTPSAETASGTALKREIKILGQDLMPINRTLSQSALQADPTITQWLLAFATIGALLTYLISWLIYRKSQLLQKDRFIFKREKAWAQFKKTVHAAPTDRHFFNVAVKSINEYITTQLSLEGGGITAADIAAKLTTLGVASATAEQAKSMMNLCEMGQYGGQSYTETELKQFRQNLLDLFKQIDKEIRS